MTSKKSHKHKTHHRTKTQEEEPIKEKRHHHHHRHRRTEENPVTESEAEPLSDEENAVEEIRKRKKLQEILKKRVHEWLDNDDKVKAITLRAKKYKDAKKQLEEGITKLIIALDLDGKKLDIRDDDNNVRSRVCRYKSTTRGGLKEDIIRDALMEIMQSERKVEHALRKIDSKRPINERYYLKRTKGSNKD